MAEVGTAYVRLRPVLDREERDALEDLSRLARALADSLDRFLGNFAEQPELEKGTTE